MKAIIYTEYGGSENLQLKEVEKPVPKENEVLVKLHATSINGSDYEFLRGKPAYARIIGLFKPRKQILGSDIAGVVEEAGKKVTQFKAGDKVFGDIFEYWGGFAEYVCAPEKKLLLKPDSMTFEEVAALPQSGVIALQGIRDKGKVMQGHKVLLNGAGGGGGSFAIQLAKMYGAEVTAVDNGNKLEMMRSLGADHVIDYLREDFSKTGLQYDFILDFTAYRSMFDYKRALKPTGIYAMVGGSVPRLFQALLLGLWLAMTGKKRMGMLAHRQNKKDINYILELIESGKIKTVIDKCYPLNETEEAFRYFGSGHFTGKVLITM